MAEAVFSDIVNKHGLNSKIKIIDSAGTAGYHIGDFPDTRTIDVCKEHGVPIDHIGRQICKEDFDEFDWILVMDQVREYINYSRKIKVMWKELNLQNLKPKFSYLESLILKEIKLLKIHTMVVNLDLKRISNRFNILV